jgi:hypothetical protein
MEPLSGLMSARATALLSKRTVPMYSFITQESMGAASSLLLKATGLRST